YFIRWLVTDGGLVTGLSVPHAADKRIAQAVMIASISAYALWFGQLAFIYRDQQAVISELGLGWTLINGLNLMLISPLTTAVLLMLMLAPFVIRFASRSGAASTSSVQSAPPLAPSVRQNRLQLGLAALLGVAGGIVAVVGSLVGSTMGWRVRLMTPLGVSVIT